jgi:outer membrane protein TolC
MTPTDEPDPAPTGPELRAERLGFALRGLAAELVDERRKVAQLRQQVANLQAQLDVAEADRASNPKPTID